MKKQILTFFSGNPGKSFQQNYSSVLIVMMILATAFNGIELYAQDVGVAISSDNSEPNANAMLDVKSPATGAGKGLLVPRVTVAQRTTANSGLAGGLLNASGELRGGAAQGLLVYQTDGTSGFYYNTSDTAIPNWVHLPSTPNAGINGQFLQTDGAGAPTWQTVQTPLPGTIISIGDSANANSSGLAIGTSSNGNSSGIAIGSSSNGVSSGTAIGSLSNGTSAGVAIGPKSMAYSSGVAVGYQANARQYGAAIGRKANGYDCNVAIGYCANAFTGYGPYSGGVSVGYRANCFSGDGKYTGGVAIGYTANARHNFNENDSGAVAIGFKSNSFIRGVGVGYKSAGYNKGVAIGYLATGSNQGVGVGYKANAYYRGTAIGYMANSGNQNYSFAKGPYSKCNRYNEEWKSSDGSYNKFGYGQVNYHGTTTTSSATEIFLGGATFQRFFISKYSVVSFQILLSAYNTNTNQTSVWRCWGGIKRGDYANTTALVGAVMIDANTQGGLTRNPTITADTNNRSLKLQVTGVNANTVMWNAQMTYSEIRKNGYSK
jgi:hypothetical protein